MQHASKYERHQGKAECARRQRQRGHRFERLAGYIALLNWTRRTVWAAMSAKAST